MACGCLFCSGLNSRQRLQAVVRTVSGRAILIFSAVLSCLLENRANKVALDFSVPLKSTWQGPAPHAVRVESWRFTCHLRVTARTLAEIKLSAAPAGLQRIEGPGEMGAIGNSNRFGNRGNWTARAAQLVPATRGQLNRWCKLCADVLNRISDKDDSQIVALRPGQRQR